MSDLKFRVKAHSENPTKTIVKARGFEIVIDEPTDLGGTNTAANPVEYILAAYAGCLNVMAHVCAKELGIEMRGIKIDLVGNLNPARLFGQSFDERAGYKEIKVTLKPDADMDEPTSEKWLKAILDRCPVGDNLKNATEIVASLKYEVTAS
ncbi:MAG: OsmC family protein [Salinivirgaceae bacterium]|nr:OsmC family protein [Salinivirgaceae bacterium]